MAGKKDPRDDRPNPKHSAHDAACLPVPPFTALIANDWARAQVRAPTLLAIWLASLGRLGWFVIRISRRRLRVLMLSNPLNRVMLGNETLDYFRFAIGP